MANAAKLTQAPIATAILGGICDLSQRSYFQGTATSSVSISFINRPADCMIFEVEIYLLGGTITWPANVRWVGGLAPQNLQTGKIHIFQFRRPQSTGADQWLGSYLPNY